MTKNNTAAIVITNNYHQDLAAARKAGVFSANGMPRKIDLYIGIEAHNAKSKKTAKLGAKSSQTAQKEWSKTNERTAQQFATATSRITRAKLISELCEVHSPKLVAEKLGLSVAKIRKEARSWPLYMNNATVYGAVKAGMGWSVIIDNIGNLSILETVCNEFVKKKQAAC